MENIKIYKYCFLIQSHICETISTNLNIVFFFLFVLNSFKYFANIKKTDKFSIKVCALVIDLLTTNNTDEILTKWYFVKTDFERAPVRYWMRCTVSCCAPQQLRMTQKMALSERRREKNVKGHVTCMSAMHGRKEFCWSSSSWSRMKVKMQVRLFHFITLNSLNQT